MSRSKDSFKFPILLVFLKMISKNFFFVIAAVLLIVYWQPILGLLESWMEKEEYSHGLFIPLIAFYILWQRRGVIKSIEFSPSWYGVILLGLAMLLLMAGVIADREIAKNYSLILTLLGVVLAVGGKVLLKETLFPIILLLFVIPLPGLLNASLTAQLQIISSELGVGFIRLLNIPVMLEGNVIDLGEYELFVAEACSGLRYLYPFISLGLIVAYFYKAPFWQRLVIVLSTVPITIFMNSFRIGMIGILVKSNGIAAAEGFLHDFEGFVVFMGATALLLFEVWVLYKLSGVAKKNPGIKFDDVFGIDVGNRTHSIAEHRTQKGTSSQAIVALFIIVLGGLAANQAGSREIYIPERESFDTFPLSLGEWTARQGTLAPSILDVLGSDDYFTGSYRKKENEAVNFLVVYFNKQQDGSAIHSPQVCLPGGGWEIIENEDTIISFADGQDSVKRTIIRQGEHKQLVYYWIQQQGQRFSNEYFARASLLMEAFKSNRTDGALVRLITMVDNDDIEAADQRLQQLLKLVAPHLPRYLPG